MSIIIVFLFSWSINDKQQICVQKKSPCETLFLYNSICSTGRLLSIYSSSSPAIALTKLLPISIKTYYLLRLAVRAYILAINNFFKVFIAFFPLFPTIKAPDRTNVAGKISTFYTYSFTIYDAVGNFFPCIIKNPLEGLS